MDYFVEFVNVVSGEHKLCEAMDQGCFGSLAGAFSNTHLFNEFKDDWFINKIIYPVTGGVAPSIHLVEDMINALNLPEMSLVRLAELPVSVDAVEELTSYGRPDLEDSFCIQLECADLDRGDAMRNLFLLRNILSSENPLSRYRKFKDSGVGTRQALAAFCLGEWPRDIGGTFNGRMASSQIFGARCFGYGHTTLKDVERFLKNPQDAIGRRSGTFREHVGVGYTTGNDGYQIVTSFTKKHNTDLLIIARKSGLIYTSPQGVYLPSIALIELLGMGKVDFTNKAK